MAIESFSSIKREIITKGKELTACLATLALSLSLLAGCSESIGGQDPSEQKPSTTASESIGGQGVQDPLEQNPPTTASEGAKPADNQNTDLSEGPVFDESTQTFSFCATAGGSEVVTVVVTEEGGDTIDMSSDECNGKSPAQIEANGYRYCQDLEEDTEKDGRPVKSVVFQTTNFDANEGQLYDAFDRSIASFYYSEFSCDKQ